jgi:hypothetical protein
MDVASVGAYHETDQHGAAGLHASAETLAADGSTLDTPDSGPLDRAPDAATMVLVCKCGGSFEIQRPHSGALKKRL